MPAVQAFYSGARIAWLATERERQLTTASVKQTTRLTNGERQMGHRKSSLVLSARFPVVKWRSRSFAKSFARESAILKLQKRGLLFLLSLIFLRHKIRDGGYNSKNINKQLSPAQNTNYFPDETILCQIFEKEFWKLNQSFRFSGRVSKEPHRLIDERLLKHPKHSKEEKLLVSTG